MNKKKLLISSTISLLSLGIAVGVANKQTGVFSSLGETGDTWVHYTGKAATFDRRGCKEYWVNCTTHEHSFEAPVGVSAEKIQEGGVLADNQLYALATNDDRLLSPLEDKLLLDFENDSHLDTVFSVRNNFATKQIVSGGVTGNCLEVTWKDGTADFALQDAWLDEAFSDSAVTGIAFDVKASSAFDVHYYNGTGQVRYIGDGDVQFHCKPTYFRTFIWSRAQYDVYKTGKYRANAMMWDGVTANETTVWLDNIRPITTLSYSDHGDVEGFDIVDSSNNWSFRENRAELFVVAGAQSITLSGDYYTSGKKSVKGTWGPNTTTKVYLNGNFSNKVGEDDIVSFDVMLKANDPADFAGYGGVNVAVGASGTPISSQGVGALLVDKWYTFQLPQSEVGHGKSLIAFGTGGRTIDFYFDNLRIIKPKADLIIADFEETQNGVRENIVNGDYWYNWKQNSTGSSVGDLRVASTDNKSILAMKTTRSIKTQGEQSLMITKKNGYISFYVGSDVRPTLEYGAKLQFDLYTTFDLTTADSNGTIMNGVNKAMPHAHTSGQWNTYTLELADLTNDGRFLIITGNTTGDIYLDNFQYLLEE